MLSPRRKSSLCLTMLALLGIAGTGPATDGKSIEPNEIAKSRTFVFTYAATITGLKPGEMARVWLPVPPTDRDQQVKVLSEDLPARGRMSQGKEYGNHILYFEAPADARGELPLKTTYHVMRREVRTNFHKGADQAEHAADYARFLEPDRLVPVGGKTLSLIKGKHLAANPVAAARELYNIVDNHMKYKKVGTGWGRGDAVWACDSGYGNCTDFHSLFISLARSRKIPAKFTIGFPLPTNQHAGPIPGYHCWAWFHPEGDGWIPVDISEANKDPKMRDYYFGNLTPDRIAFSTGRDIDLTPKQDGPPLNYFIYPYVEVHGKPYPQTKIKNHFSFKDVMQK